MIIYLNRWLLAWTHHLISLKGYFWEVLPNMEGDLGSDFFKADEKISICKIVLCDSGIDNIQQFKSSLFLRPEQQYLDSISKYCNRFKIIGSL